MIAVTIFLLLLSIDPSSSTFVCVDMTMNDGSAWNDGTGYDCIAHSPDGSPVVTCGPWGLSDEPTAEEACCGCGGGILSAVVVDAQDFVAGVDQSPTETLSPTSKASKAFSANKDMGTLSPTMKATKVLTAKKTKEATPSPTVKESKVPVGTKKGKAPVGTKKGKAPVPTTGYYVPTTGYYVPTTGYYGKAPKALVTKKGKAYPSQPSPPSPSPPSPATVPTSAPAPAPAPTAAPKEVEQAAAAAAAAEERKQAMQKVVVTNLVTNLGQEFQDENPDLFADVVVAEMDENAGW